jgi:hypothetical protein
MSLAFPWSITSLRLSVVAGLIGEEHLDAVTTLSLPGVLKEVLVVVSQAAEEQPSAVVGGAGEIGRKYARSLWFVISGIADVM